jgi:FKBP-type peptidyl-prolyl cis-trans isomerase 2
MDLRDGDVVRFDYTLYLDGAKPVETSDESVARMHGLWEEGRGYAPLTLALGARQIIAGLEEEVRKRAQPGASFTVDVPPEKAYGERDVHNVKDVPMAQFRRQKVKPEVGLVLNYEGKRAIVSRVAGGRVRLDLNHELAGRTLRYDVTIREIIHDDAGKIKAVLESLFSAGAEHAVSVDGVTVYLPDAAKFDQEWPLHKFRLLTLLRQAVGVEKEIRLVEVYPAMRPAAEDEAAAPAKASTKASTKARAKVAAATKRVRPTADEDE